MLHRLQKRGVESKLILTDAQLQSPQQDETLIKLIAKAHAWLTKLTDGTIPSIDALAKQENQDRNEISRTITLAFLAPNIIKAILNGTQPPTLTAQKLRRPTNLPQDWHQQRKLLGFKN